MKRLFLTVACMTFMVTLCAQNERIIVNRIIKQLKLNAQEKTYTHTDASDYAAGDRIWLKVYVVNALSHEPTSESLYAYVELIAPDETVVNEAKILCRDGVYAGYLDIPQEAVNGRYMLRSYTNMSKNAANYESFHPIYIGGGSKKKNKKGNHDGWKALDENAKLKYTRQGNHIAITTQHEEDSLMLLAHCRAYPFCITPISRQHPVIWHQDSIPQGIVSLLLVNNNLEVIEDRLLLSNNGQEQCQIDIKTDKEQYGINDIVDMTLQVPDLHEGEIADISVSVTGTTLAKRHRPSSIIAHLMLATDVEGGLDNPELYLANTQRADSLLAHYRWTRYDVNEVLKGKYSMPEYKCETTQGISGQVKTLLWQKPVENATVSLISPKNGCCAITTTDENGQFFISGLDYPQDTQYVLKAINENGKDNVELLIDEKKRPTFLHNAFSEELFENTPIIADPVQYKKQDVIMLDDVEVVENKRNSASSADTYSSRADHSFGLKQIEELGVPKLSDLIRYVPGVIIERQQSKIDQQFKQLCFLRTPTSLLNDRRPAAIAINGLLVKYDDYDIDEIEMQDVARVDVFRTAGSTVIWGSIGSSGVISITLKDGVYSTNQSDPVNLKRITPMGFQKKSSFIELPGNKTIYWNPHVTSNQIQLNVPNRAGTCHVVVEGVTTEGRLIHEERDIIVKP